MAFGSREIFQATSRALSSKSTKQDEHDQKASRGLHAGNSHYTAVWSKTEYQKKSVWNPSDVQNQGK